MCFIFLECDVEQLFVYQNKEKKYIGGWISDLKVDIMCSLTETIAVKKKTEEKTSFWFS